MACPMHFITGYWNGVREYTRGAWRMRVRAPMPRGRALPPPGAGAGVVKSRVAQRRPPADAA
ncbi:hypothetical protein CBM2599_A160005 [Cupriavidus taiwanensis]|nr:hypothetical protein CBM2599_A160005 [Cupriavidus taiwanensis]SOY84793.1 hypothetical protein CBM2600_A140265 [Cupriavidus taiwanensis]SPA26619.1 hypothetical protein CBM2637_A200409 [Cupriavidus taiwanensis]